MQSERDRPGAGRLGLVSGLLADALRTLPAGGQPISVLDCGGGSGAFAVPLAVSGCVVTVVDISADALTTLRRRADEAGVAGAIRPVNGDVESLGELVPVGGFDVVLAHGILDALDRIGEALVAIMTAVRPGGLISVLVANPVASVIARALAGEPSLALDELRALDSGPPRLGPEQVIALCRQAGLALEGRHGIGAFSDLVSGAAVASPDAREALRSLDVEAAGRAPFADIAGRIHLIFRRPGP